LSGEFRRRRCRSRRVRRYAERVPFALAEDEDEDEVGAESPVSVPAPRCPVDAVSEACVAVPAALVRGRCFMTGRETGARPVESRKLALTVLCALADQEHARAQASSRVYAYAPGEGFALGRSPFLENSRLPRQGTFAGPFRPTGALGHAEHTESTGIAERAVLAGWEAA